VLVGELEAVGGPRAGADDLAAAWQGQEPGAGDGAGGGIQDELLGAAEQVQGGLPGVFLEQQVAVGVVDIAGGAGGGGVRSQFPVVSPGQGLLAGRQVAGQGVPVGVVDVRGGAAARRAGGTGRGESVGLAAAVGVAGDRVLAAGE
jgi:hypothetical protein